MKGSGKNKRGRPRKAVRNTSNSPQTTMLGETNKNVGKFDIGDLRMPSLPCFGQNPRETVHNVLVTFDELRRRLRQLDYANGVKNRQPHYKASKTMIDSGIHLGGSKRIGEVPGVEVGDIFFYRVEMHLVGLHNKDFEGIDFMSALSGDNKDLLATCIVASHDKNNVDDPNVLIYIGKGNSGIGDQKLKRGNLALDMSERKASCIRVIRSEPNPVAQHLSKIYIYDGLYSITEIWMEEAKYGSMVFQHKLVREPGQPDGTAVWKRTPNWRQYPESRGHLIMLDLSVGSEKTKVYVVNEVDNEGPPINFTYTTKLDLGDHETSASKQGCICTSKRHTCRDCSCLHKNGYELPYTSSGTLVIRKAMLYECSDSCSCSDGCHNRHVQKGSFLHFEVFKTTDRGWSLRSWDPICANTFICEYDGEVIDRYDVNREDDYIFEATRSGHNLRWNYIPELLGQPTFSDPDDTFFNLPIIISARRCGNVARFMNHSCSPNVFWQPVMYGHAEEGYPHIAFFAIKHIPPITELTFDYGSSGRRQPRDCLCQSPKCRATFG